MGMLDRFLDGIAFGASTYTAPRAPFWGVFPFSVAGGQIITDQVFDLGLERPLVVYAIGASASAGRFVFEIRTAAGRVNFSGGANGGSAQIRSDALFGPTPGAIDPVVNLRKPFIIAAKSLLLVDIFDRSGAPNTGQIVLLGYFKQGLFS